jgi:ribosomal protein S27AE
MSHEATDTVALRGRVRAALKALEGDSALRALIGDSPTTERIIVVGPTGEALVKRDSVPVPIEDANTIALRGRDAERVRSFKEAFVPDSTYSDYAKALLHGEAALGCVIPTKTLAWLDARVKREWKTPVNHLYRFWRRCRYCRDCGLPYLASTWPAPQPMNLPGWRITNFIRCNRCRARRAKAHAVLVQKRQQDRLARLRQATVESLKNRTCANCGDTLIAQKRSRRYCSTRCRVAAHRERTAKP